MTSIDFDSTSRFVTTPEARVHLNETGDGPPLVLLHGGGPGGSGWSNFKQNVATLSKSFRVLVIDQVGYGLTDKPEFDEPYYVLSARVIRDVLDILGIKQADFVGNSLGGGTALRLAIDYPDRVRRLILMGPGGGAKNIFAVDPAEGQKVLIDFYAAPGPTREKMRRLVEIMTYDHSFVTDDLIEERFAAATAPGAEEGALRALRSIGSSASPNENQLWRHLANVPHRTLLMWGRDDRTMPLDGAFFALKEMPDAQLHVFPRCGHWAQLEHQDAFDRLTTDFLLH
ncbi:MULTISPECIES: alpha/beta fold hydrolase [unclassified Nocardioides]|uniref:alpha/beta fold hydrolase n=1 Tax=unclassified Nocardioides TaxID=2615069 RepID=UPI00005717B9|nr:MULTISPECIES: alpha/beta fold hydrolase [unclassified Nocardioides]ABL81650.1 alpha/beta hydrolase fold protein [Nocardioides sp. JS614]